MKLFKLLAAATAMAALPAFAMAATVDLGATAQVTPTVQVGSTGTNAIVSANGTDNATVNGNGTSSDDSLQGSGTATVGTDVNGVLTITQGDVSNSPDTITSSSMVSSDADFSAYAQSELHQNPDIKEIDADNSSVTVQYGEPAYLFGVIPVTMTASAKVAADGSVTVSYPWYHFLTTSSTNEAAINAGISTQAAMIFNQEPSQASEGATSTVSANATLTASQKAELLDDIRQVLSSTLVASSTVSAQ